MSQYTRCCSISWWGRESWLLCLICLPGVSWWLSGSSSRCHGVVCDIYWSYSLTNFVTFPYITLRRWCSYFSWVCSGTSVSLKRNVLYCKSWDLEVNPVKTKITIFSNRKPSDDPKFMFNWQELDVDDSFVYLGTMFSYNGRFIKKTETLWSSSYCYVCCFE